MPNENSALTVAASVIGMVLGTAGFVMSILTYLRDRARVKVTLQWKMQNLKTGQSQGLVRITNIGRRPVFISSVALELPKGFKRRYLVKLETIGGTKLDEGEKPMGILIPYDGLEQYSKVWRKIRAYAEDSTGRQYHSSLPLKDAETPPWVKTA
jgi:hypothetical protein